MGTETVPPPGNALDVELAALRARAYGANADIEDDPTAIERLAELEDWHAASARTDEAADGIAPSGRMPTSRRPSSDDDGARQDVRTTTPAVRARLRQLFRGSLGQFLLGAAAMGAVILLGAALLAVGSPRPDAVLAETDRAPGAYVLRLVDYARELLITKTTLQAHEPFLGVEVWSADSALGNRCVIALERTSNRLLAASCVPPGAEPTIDIYNVPILSGDDWHDGLPMGSVVRFTLDGDSVQAWLYPGSSRH